MATRLGQRRAGYSLQRTDMRVCHEGGTRFSLWLGFLIFGQLFLLAQWCLKAGYAFKEVA